MSNKAYSGVPAPTVIAKLICEKHHFKTMRDSREIFYYKDGVYIPLGVTYIEEKVSEICETSLSKHFINEVIYSIQINTYCDRSYFDKDIDIINVKNGLLNIKTKELLSHTPEYPSIMQLPITFNPNADCPKTKKFLSEILNPQDVPVILEFIGYCLYRKYSFAKALMLTGSGSNGKSQLLALIREFLGNNNVKGITWQQLENSEFLASGLYNKLANIAPDLKSTSISDTGTFKTLTGGDSSSFDKKYSPNTVDFVNYAKLIFSANELPPITQDNSHAIWRRWILIKCTGVFEAGKNAVEEIYLTLLDELPGLLNLALDGLGNLLESKKFSYSPSIDQVAIDYKRASDNIQSFLSECCKFGADYSVHKDFVYNQYLGYCKDFDLQPKDNIRFGIRLKQLYPNVESTKARDGAKLVQIYKGIKIERQGNFEFIELDD